LQPFPLQLIADKEWAVRLAKAREKAYYEHLSAMWNGKSFPPFTGIAESAQRLDISQIQDAFAEIKTACDNLSKVKINISIY
jgi:hypothetical protein